MKRLRWAGVGLAVGLACALAATPASAATWRGTAHGKFERSSRLVEGGTTWQGDFWFETNRRGDVRGHAIVAYEPSVQVDGITNAIVYIRDVTSAAMGMLGPWGEVAAGAGLTQIVGANVSFDSAMAVRQGDLTGKLQHGRLNLDWHSKLPGIPYNIEFQLVSATKRVGGGRAALRSPFSGAGRLMGRRTAVFSDESHSSEGDVEQTVGSYWVAHRVR
jgi:hypothetical protein